MPSRTPELFKVKVNPTKVLKYPDRMREVCDPELEKKEPFAYNLLTQVELWLHPEQRGHGKASGYVIYDYLKSHDELQNHLSYADLLAIKKLGIDVFRKLYGNKAVYAWASVTRWENGILYVPCLCAYSNDVVIKWRCLSRTLDALSPALVFKKSK